MAQVSTFNERFGEINWSDSSVFTSNNCRTIAYNDSNIIVVFTQNFPFEVLELHFMEISYEGQVNSEKVYTDSLHWWFQGFNSSGFIAENGDILEAGSKQSVIDFTGYPMIYRFSPTGDTLWTRIYNSENIFAAGDQIIEASNGDLLVVGRTVGDTATNNPQVLVFRTDSAGNLLWYEDYGNPTTTGEWGSSIIENEEGGYFVGGQFNEFNGSNSNMLLTKIDGEGNEIWTHIFPNGELYDENSIQLLSTSDGNYLMGGATGGSYSISEDHVKWYIREFDIDDNTIWENNYGTSKPLAAILALKEDWAGNIIVAGESQDPGQRVGSLLRINQNGDSLWMRNYRYLNDSSFVHFCVDVTPLPDSSYALAGWVLVLPPAPAYGQDVWVVKVDSMGCIEPGCHIIDGLEEIVFGLENSMEFFPNPAHTFTTLRFNLPLQSIPEKTRIEIYDLQGKKVEVIPLPIFGNGFEKEIDVSKFNSGLYTVHWLSARLPDGQGGSWYDSVKLIVH